MNDGKHFTQENNNNNNYTPPVYPTLDPPTKSELMGTTPDHQFPNNNYSNVHRSTMNFQLIQIEDRLTSFTVYIAITWILLVLSILGLFKSILFLSIIFDNEEIEIDDGSRYFEIFNFLMVVGHIVGYFYGIQAYTKQKTFMNKYYEMVLLALAGVNLLYLLIFFVITASFILWCVTMFYLILNVLLYFQAKELTIVLSEKEVLNSKRNVELYSHV
jgi:hypothetical protein